MKTTADRLKELMDQNGWKQVDILKKVQPYCETYHVKLGKSDLSQFVNGKVKPGQSKLSLLSVALNVSEGWLMGLDVPQKRNATPYEGDNKGLDSIDIEIADIITKLSPERKQEALLYLQYLLSLANKSTS